MDDDAQSGVCFTAKVLRIDQTSHLMIHTVRGWKGCGVRKR